MGPYPLALNLETRAVPSRHVFGTTTPFFEPACATLAHLISFDRARVCSTPMKREGACPSARQRALATEAPPIRRACSEIVSREIDIDDSALRAPAADSVLVERSSRHRRNRAQRLSTSLARRPFAALAPQSSRASTRASRGTGRRFRGQFARSSVKPSPSQPSTPPSRKDTGVPWLASSPAAAFESAPVRQ
jgi:hypothetical protein